MEFLGVNLDIKNLPEPRDPEFIPLHKFNEAFLRGARSPSASRWSARAARWPQSRRAYTARRKCTPPTAITSTAL